MAAENFKVKKGLEVGTGITANSDGVNVTGIVTATQFQGDGSGLTGVVGSGSGIVVKHDGSTVGTAGTINFSTNLDVSAIFAGIVTVTATASGGSIDTDSQGNTVGGSNAGDNFSTGGYTVGATNNTLFGFDTGTDITSGWDNNCFGYQAGANITTGNNNICIGQQAGFDVTIQNKLIAIGNRAAYNNATSSGTVAIGYRALYTNVSGTSNHMIGNEAGYSVTGSYNFALGPFAMRNAGAANNNVAIGYQAMQSISTGSQNLALGYGAGNGTLSTGSNNIMIGYNADASASDVSNEITLGDANINHLRVPGIGLTFTSSGANITGVITATGANITGIATFTGGVAKLLFNGNQKLITTINGIEVPDLNVTGVGTVGRLDTNGVTLGTNNNTFAAKFADDAVANFGTDNDLKISHDDTHARITNTKGDIVVVGIISATSDVKVGSAITMDPTSGIITATKFVGDGSDLTGISGGGGGFSPDAQNNLVSGTNAGDSFSGTDAGHNLLLGFDAGTAITSGDDNIFLGRDAGKTTSVYSDNVYIGPESGRLNNQSNNVCIGNAAGAKLTGAADNVYIGTQAGEGLFSGTRTGSKNVGLGKYALAEITTGGGNVVLGDTAGNKLQSGSDNVIIGTQAATTGTNDLVSGSNNIILGHDAVASSASASNEITLGDTNITKLRVPGINVVLKDNGGTPTEGHVLTVDASGEASFAAASGGGGGATDKIEEGNSSVEVVDSGTGYVSVVTDNYERARFSGSGLNQGKIFVGDTTGVSNSYGSNAGHVVIVRNSGSEPATLRLFGYGPGASDGTINNRIDFASHQSGSGGQTFAKIESVIRGSSDNSSDLTFHTASSATVSEKLRILSDGNVGIGITNPTSKLHVNGGAKVVGVMTATTFSGSGASLTSLDAGNLGVGTIPNGRFPATLPAASGANLTSLTAGNISGTIATGQIADNAVTFAKMQDVGTGVFIGRNDSGSGDIETLTAAEARTLLNVADGATAGITTANSNIQVTWTVTASGQNYRLTGPGNDGTENHPDLYLVRGQRYRFIHNATSSHPLQIQTTGGSVYTDGVTYSENTNGGQTTQGNNLDFNVQHDAPAQLTYNCTAHGGMEGNIYIVGQHLANGANNRVLTATSAYGMNGESGLTYDGSYLGVTGDIAVSTTNRVYFGNSDVAWVKGVHGGSGYLELGVNTGHVRILRNGRVGIGTEDPHTQLTVAADSAQAIVTLKRTNSNGGAGSYGAINFAALDGHSVANMYALGDGNDDGAHLIFKTTSAAASNDTYNAATEERLRIKSNGIIVAGNSGTSYGNALIQSFTAHGSTAGESAFSAVDTTSVAAGVGGEIAFHGKFNTGAQDYAYLGHIRGIKENATNGNTACALTFHTRPNATTPQERLRINSSGKINIGDADQTQNTDQLSVTIAAQNTLDNVARFQSAAAASGTSESLVKIYKGTGYGGVISGYITQGSDHGMKFYTADNGSLTERLRISKPGHITTPSNPAFHARPPGNYTIPGNGIIGGTWSTSDSESFVRGTLANGNSIWDNSTGIFTVPVTGIYYIHWSVFLASNTTRRDAYIYRGSDIIARTEIGDPEGTTGNNKNVSVSTVVSLSVNEEIKFAALTTGGTTIYTTAKPWSYACAYLVG